VKLPWRRQAAPDPSIAATTSASPVSSSKASARKASARKASARKASASQVSPSLLAWANALDATRLSPDTVASAERFLRDYRRMGTLNARREIALRLRALIEAEVTPRPPVSASSMDVIATAVTVRRKQLGLG
jgi:hypothetical protein